MRPTYAVTAAAAACAVMLSASAHAQSPGTCTDPTGDACARSANTPTGDQAPSPSAGCFAHHERLVKIVGNKATVQVTLPCLTPEYQYRQRYWVVTGPHGNGADVPITSNTTRYKVTLPRCEIAIMTRFEIKGDGGGGGWNGTGYPVALPIPKSYRAKHHCKPSS